MSHSPMVPCFAMLGLWLGLSPAPARVEPVHLTRRTEAGESRYHRSPRRGGDSAESTSCRTFVSRFYAWYRAQSKNGGSLPAALRRKRANFSPELVRGLEEDAAAAARSPNEIVGLDSDPVLNAQDYADRYVVGKVTHRGSRFLVEVFGVSAGKRNREPDVIPVLRHEGGRWVFTNFLYRADGKSDDLLSLLKQLKADREKRSRGR